jgi:hypothetical protein
MPREQLKPTCTAGLGRDAREGPEQLNAPRPATSQSYPQGEKEFLALIGGHVIVDR